MNPTGAALAAHTADICRDLVTLLTSLPDEDALRAGVRDVASRLAGAAEDPGGLPAYRPEGSVLLREPDAALDRSPVTGRVNPLAPPVGIEHGPGWAQAEVVMPAAYQGPPGRLHGGFVAVLLDHVMGSAAHSDGGPLSYTRYLNVTYDAGTPTGEPIVVRGEIDHRDGRKTVLRGTVTVGGEVTARAEGLWVAPRG